MFEGMSDYLNAWWYVIYDAYGFAVRMPRQRVRNDMVLHLPSWLVARLYTVDSFTSGTLETEEKGQIIWFTGSNTMGTMKSHCLSLAYLPSLLPLLYMATRHWKWYWCPHCVSRPTDSARDTGPTPGPLYPEGPPNGSIQMVQS